MSNLVNENVPSIINLLKFTHFKARKIDKDNKTSNIYTISNFVIFCISAKLFFGTHFYFCLEGSHFNSIRHSVLIDQPGNISVTYIVIFNLSNVKIKIQKLELTQSIPVC